MVLNCSKFAFLFAGHFAGLPTVHSAMQTQQLLAIIVVIANLMSEMRDKYFLCALRTQIDARNRRWAVHFLPLNRHLCFSRLRLLPGVVPAVVQLVINLGL